MMKHLQSIHLGRLGIAVALAICFAVGFKSNATAQVTYLDANWTDAINTTLLDGSALVPGPNNAAAGDDNWRIRTGGAGFGHGLTILESNGNANNATTNPENAPMLKTTITGLTPNTEYNIYAYFWSQTSALQDWKLKATINAADINDNGTPGVTLDDFLPTLEPVSFSKFGSLTPPVATNTPALPVGFDGTDNLGVTFDVAGLSTSYFSTPTRIKQVDNTLVMFQASLGLAMSDGSGQVNVYVDDMEEQPSSNLRTWYDGVGFSLPGLPTLTINRDTGEMVFTTGVERDIIGYSIRSASGTLNQDEWTTITGTYDDAGNGTVDDNDNWLVLTNPDSVSDLSEAEFGVTGPMDGALLEPGTEIDFGTPWRQYFVEDVTMQILLDDVDGTVENVLVVYEGNDDLSFLEGDFNFDGDIDPLDYSIFIGSLFDDITGSVVEAYALGDLTGDIAVSYEDLVEFRDIYDAANGAGAFQALANGATVPEPQSIALLACVGAMLLVHYRKQVVRFALSSNGRSVAQVAGVVGILILVVASGTSAQTTYVDATETPVGNTTLLNGTDFTSPGDVNANDGLWRKRGFGNDNTIFETNAAGTPGENGHMLVTTIGSLVPNAEYYIYSYFWSNPLENWRLKATINTADIMDNGTPGDLTDDLLGNDPTVSFSANGSPTSTTAPLAQARHFASPTLVRDLDTNPNILLYEAALGTIIADGSGQAKVYIDDLENQTSAQLRTFYDGVGYERVLPLTLRVNTTTGATSLINEAGAPINFTFYEITSASNSLNVAGWDSLDMQNIDAVDGTDVGSAAGDSQLEGWDGGGGSDDGQLGEVNFLSSSTLANLSSFSLGNAFKIGGMEDLELSFEIGGRLRTGNVVYVEGIPGDYDGNGTVEAADYTEWKSLFGTTDPDADGNGDNVVNAADYVIWRDHLGQSASGSGAGSSLGAVPEPSAILLSLTAAMLGGILILRNRNWTQLKAISIRAGVLAGVLLTFVSSAVQAEVRNDREYSFGEDSLEAASNNAIIGSNNTAPLAAGNSADSAGTVAGTYLDITQSGGPTYVDVAGGEFIRPGAASGTFGAKFDGVDDHLTGVPLNRPDELATVLPGYPINYAGITARGMQMWVRPNSASIGVRRQTILMDTVAMGGVSITADGKWTQIFDGHFDDDDITPTVPVVGNQWYHVMHHVYRANDPGSPTIVPGSGSSDLGFSGVVYVNGIAVSASNDTPALNDRTGGFRAGVLVVGAEELPEATDLTLDPIIGNYFDGAIDDLEMYVYGDNTLQGGEDYGTFDLFDDNEWIADQISAIPGGVLKNGDLNRDGDVTLADRDDFVDGWLKQKVFGGAHNDLTAGDWETWTWGDMDHDGQVFLKDAFILHRALMQSGLGGLDFSLLGSSNDVPEPSAGLLLAMACGIAFAGYRRRKRTPVCS